MQDNKQAKARKTQRLVEQYDRAVRTTIRATRVDRDLEQQDVANEMGWSVELIANIEQGRRKVTLSELIVLGKAMGVEPEVIFRRVMGW